MPKGVEILARSPVPPPARSPKPSAPRNDGPESFEKALENAKPRKPAGRESTPPANPVEDESGEGVEEAVDATEPEATEVQSETGLPTPESDSSPAPEDAPEHSESAEKTDLELIAPFEIALLLNPELVAALPPAEATIAGSDGEILDPEMTQPLAAVELFPVLEESTATFSEAPQSETPAAASVDSTSIPVALQLAEDAPPEGDEEQVTPMPAPLTRSVEPKAQSAQTAAAPQVNLAGPETDAQSDGENPSELHTARPPITPEAPADAEPADAFPRIVADLIQAGGSQHRDLPATGLQLAPPADAVAPKASSAPPTPVTEPAPAPVPRELVASNHERIVSSVRTQLLPNGGTMHLRLDPPEMGALQVTVRMVNGAMTATFETSTDQATRMLSHSLGQLKHVLETQGVSVERLHVQQGMRDEQPNPEGEDRQRQSSQDDQLARREQQRREVMNRMWRRLRLGRDPLDMVA